MPSLRWPSAPLEERSMCASSRAWYLSLMVVRKFQPLALRIAACFTASASTAAGLLMPLEVQAMHTTGTARSWEGFRPAGRGDRSGAIDQLTHGDGGGGLRSLLAAGAGDQRGDGDARELHDSPLLRNCSRHGVARLRLVLGQHEQRSGGDRHQREADDEAERAVQTDLPIVCGSPATILVIEPHVKFPLFRI